MNKNPYKLNNLRYSTHGELSRLIGKNKIILDVGCNDGYMNNILDKSNTLYGIDNKAESIKKAKKVYKDAKVSDLDKIDKLPWKNKFDVILFADVLEHLMNPNQLVKLFVKNYLKSGGTVVISVPNVANWLIRYKLVLGRFDYRETGIMDRTHIHFYTFKTALSLIDVSQLKIVKISGGSNYFGPIISLLPFLRPLLSTGIIIVAKKDK